MSDDVRTADTASSLAGNGLKKSSRPSIEIGGKKYRARFIDDNLRAEWENYLRVEAFKESMRVTGDPVTATRVVVEMGMSKTFRWGGPLSNSMMALRDGGIKWAALVLGCKPEVVESVMGEPGKKIPRDPVKKAELDVLLDQICAESFPDPEPGEVPEEVEPNPTSGASA